MQTVESAKQFLLNRLLEQASAAGISLSDLEKRMFLFSEVSQRPPDWEANERFEAECDQAEYERKIARLLRKAYAHDKKTAGSTEIWTESLKALAKEDFYGLAMLDQAKIPRPTSYASMLSSFLDPAFVTFAVFEFLIVALAFVNISGHPSLPFFGSDVARFFEFAVLIALAWQLGRVFGRFLLEKRAGNPKYR